MKNKIFLEFNDAVSFIRDEAKKYGINGYNKWQEIYIKNSNFPKNIPKQPHITYKNKGWISWGHWLGTNNIYNKDKKFLEFNDALEIVRGESKLHKIFSKKEWDKKYIELNYINRYIPSNPHRTYKNKGWISWGHWLGTNNRTGGQRKYNVNNNFFKAWSHDMAYILGFWFADGNIKNKKILTINQNKKDKKLMIDILKSIVQNGRLYIDKRDESVYIQINSKAIYNDIVTLGGIEAKSLTVDFPKIPKEYCYDFLRGNFDGDGSIYYDKYNKKYFSCFCSASEKFIKGIENVFIEEKIPCKIIFSKNNYSNMYYLRFNAENTKKLGKFLYRIKEEIKMDRKYILFENSYLIN